MLAHCCNRFRKNQAGVTIVEFALLFPLFLLIVMGLIEFSFATTKWVVAELTLTNVARENSIKYETLTSANIEKMLKDNSFNIYEYTGNTCFCMRQYATTTEARNAPVASCRDAFCQPTYTGTSAGQYVVYDILLEHQYITPLKGLIDFVTSGTGAKNAINFSFHEVEQNQ